MRNRTINILLKLKKYKFLPEVLFTILFFITYLPHFLYCWVPQILTDTHAYMFVAKDLFEGNLPLKNYKIDLPYGFSAFITLIFKLDGSIRSVVLWQTVLFYFSFLFLIKQLKKVSFFVGVISVLFLWFYCSTSESLLWNTLIYTESIYISSLVMISSFIIRYLITKQIKFIYLVHLFILLAIYIRSNAIYLFFIPFIFSAEAFLSKNGQLKHIITAFVLMLLISSTSNYFIKGYFLPGESARLVERYDRTMGVSNVEDTLKRNLEESNIIRLDPILQSYKLFTNITNTEFGQHYYYRIPNHIKVYNREGIKKRIIENGHILRYKINSESVDEHVSFFLTNNTLDENRREEMIINTDMKLKPRNLWILFNHVVEISAPISRNWLILILFYGFFIISIVKLLQTKAKFSSQWYLIFVLSLIHFSSLVLYAITVPRDTSLSRYAIATEFIIYPVIILGFYYLLKKSRIKLNKG